MLKNGANKVANGSKAALGSGYSALTNTASKGLTSSKAALGSGSSTLTNTASKGLTSSKAALGSGYSALTNTASKGLTGSKAALGSGYSALTNTASKGLTSSKTALGSGYSALTNTASKGLTSSKAAISSSGAFLTKTSSQIGMNASLLFNTIKGNMILFGATISIGFIQIIGIIESKSKGIAFALSGILSMFILFFVSLFPLISNFGNGLPVTLVNIFAHIFNPVNNFFILLIPTLMNFIESAIEDSSKYVGKITEEVKDNANYTGKQTEKALEEIEDVVEGYTTCINATGNDIKEISMLTSIETKKLWKNIILVLTSFITFIYLLIITAYGSTSSYISSVVILLYFGLLAGFSYLKYEIFTFYKYFTTDDFEKKFI